MILLDTQIVGSVLKFINHHYFNTLYNCPAGLNYEVITVSLHPDGQSYRVLDRQYLLFDVAV